MTSFSRTPLFPAISSDTITTNSPSSTDGPNTLSTTIDGTPFALTQMTSLFTHCYGSFGSGPIGLGKAGATTRKYN